jgi:hypothetical protein
MTSGAPRDDVHYHKLSVAQTIYYTTVQQFIPNTFTCIIVLLIASASAANSESVPLRPGRPPVLGDQTSVSKIGSERSSCQLRLSEIAEFKSMPPITGPGECTATDVVDVNAVVLRDGHRVLFSPVVTLQCSMAEAVAHWIRDDVAPTLDAMSMSLRAFETLESFGCRTFNGISGAKLSEHGHANALDVHSLKIANGTVIELTNATVSKPLRERLRETACARFSTVLGNGADAYHENHVHIDLMQRTNNYKICQWNISDPTEIAVLPSKKPAAEDISAPTQSNGASVPRPGPPIETEISNLTRQKVLQSPEGTVTQPPHASSGEHLQEQIATIGPWTISASHKADDFDACTISRSTEGMEISFVRTRDSLLLFLQSQKWNLERGKVYPVRLVAGSRSVETTALAESKAVTVTLADRSLNESLSTADVLEVRGEGATLRVPLDGSAAALARLHACWERKNGRASSDDNPFVAPANHSAHQVRRSRSWRPAFFFR